MLSCYLNSDRCLPLSSEGYNLSSAGMYAFKTDKKNCFPILVQSQIIISIFACILGKHHSF